MATVVSAFHPDFRDLYKGLQSHHVASDLQQHMSLALERQLSGQLNSYASLINIPLSSQTPKPSTLANIPSLTAKSSTKHPPLTASNSANCSVSSILRMREHRKLDRSISEPVDKSQQILRSLPPNSSRYKTELCRPFEENGSCKYGDKCQFAHGISELRTLTRHPKYKTELCRTFHSTGFCPYGPRCHFIHNNDDSKKCLMNTLKSSSSIPVTGSFASRLSSLDKEYDICGFSLGSAGEMSPTDSLSSSGSPTSSLNSFFLDDSQSFSLSQVPQTAPSISSSEDIFGPDYNQKPLSVIPPLVHHSDFLSPVQNASDVSLISSLDMMVSEMELSCPIEGNKRPTSTSEEIGASYDVNRNVIRLPIFSRISLGSSP